MTASSALLRRASLPAFLASGLFAAATASAQITSPSVAAWASKGNVVSLAPGSTLGIASFETEIETAFANGIGGTIDFESYGSNGTSQSSIVSSFNGGLSTLTISISGANATANTAADATNASSGSIYMGFPTAATDRTFTFSEPLSVFGIVGISRGSVRTPTIIFTLEDTSTVTLTDGIGITADNTLFNYKSIGGNDIVSVTIGMPDGFARFDDIGFVSAVPEPGTYAAMAGLVILGFAAYRRRAFAR